MTEPEVLTRTEEGRALPYLAWRFAGPRAAASTAAVGGGLGHRHWVINAQVSHDYGRHDLDRHADELAREAGLAGAGITMFTAAEISRGRRAIDAGVCAWATVGLTDATWAAAPDPPDGPSELGASRPSAPGTINLVVSLPVALSDAALLNALCTATEAKCQALAERGVPGTGTPSDAVTVVCAATGAPEPFGGPRSVWGARLARAVHAAVRAGVTPS